MKNFKIQLDTAVKITTYQLFSNCPQAFLKISENYKNSKNNFYVFLNLLIKNI